MNWEKYDGSGLKVGMFVLNELNEIKFIGDLNDSSGMCGCCYDHITMYCDDYVELLNKNLEEVKEYWENKLNDQNNP